MTAQVPPDEADALFTQYGENETVYVLGSVVMEMARQLELKKAGRFRHLASEMSLPAMAVCLMEEVGEVARAIHDLEPLPHLYEELIQVAAVAMSAALGVQARIEEELKTVGAPHGQ